MITLEKITEDNFEECISLTLSEQQRTFIASKAYSLCEAYALTNHELYIPVPYAIYYEDIMVGFIMVVYQPIDVNGPDDDENIYYLSRIMIDRKYQGLGHGKVALKKVIELIKTFPHRVATAVVLSSDSNNQLTYSLFQSFRFREWKLQIQIEITILG